MALSQSEMLGAYVLQGRSTGRDASTGLIASTGVYELMSIAIAPAHQRRGLDATLLQHAIASARELGATRLEVGTGTFGDQLAYYQKAGFRPFALEVDFFLKDYGAPISENGIQHKDMMRLAITFSPGFKLRAS